MNGHHILQILILYISAFGTFCRNLVYKGRRLPFASLHDLKEAIKNKWKEVTIKAVQKYTTQWNKNLAIANRSHVSRAHNTLRASIITRELEI